jgi:MOSC domain-containing protein YiiM
MATNPPGRLVSVNVGRRRTVHWRDRDVATAIWKDPVDGPVGLGAEGADGDVQADQRVHGGVDKAVYAYALEDYRWWEPTTGALAPGTFGENLTTEGLDLVRACVGDRWRIGEVVLEVSEPREPCFKLGIRMGDDQFPGRFEEAERFGAYLRVIETGTVEAGQAIELTPATPPRLRVASLVDLTALDPEALAVVAGDDRVSPKIRRRAERLATR